jgi:hypothetical protein
MNGRADRWIRRTTIGCVGVLALIAGLSPTCIGTCSWSCTVSRAGSRHSRPYRWMGWKLWFGSLRPFAVDTGHEYLAALEKLIGTPPQLVDSWFPVEPSALPRALDHLDTLWLATAGQRLFKRPAFARSASLAEAAASAVEFEARCTALYDVLSMLTVPRVDMVQGPLNFLKEDLKRRITDRRSAITRKAGRSSLPYADGGGVSCGDVSPDEATRVGRTAQVDGAIVGMCDRVTSGIETLDRVATNMANLCALVDVQTAVVHTESDR